VPQSSDSTAAAAPADARPRVLIVGTSLTAGYGLDIDDAYPAVLQRMADSAGFAVRVVNAGSSGETSAGALRRIDWLLSEPAALVVIETGANDGLRGLDIDSTAANLRAIVARIRERAPAAHVVIAQMEAPPNLGPEYTRRFRELFGTVTRETDATLMRFLLEGVAGVAALNQSDGIHPTPEGSKRVAANVWRALLPLLREYAR
jgi:acyl-CoA thioesterase-1